MTYPESVPELSNAVVDTAVEPTVTRIGVVASIVESDNITVRISGSNVLVQASYLFPQYQPLAGDRVVVQRQGAAWWVLGTLSGPINTAIPNPSFELNPVGVAPSSWTLQVISSGAGVPTFLVSNGFAIAGLRTADLGVDSVLAGSSEANVFSTPVPAAPESKWTAGMFVNVLTEPSQNDFSDLDLYIQFLDASSTLVTEFLVQFSSYSVDQITLDYFRLSPRLFPGGFVTCPPAASQVRMRVRARWQLPANSFFTFYLDYMILRQV
jgi:hypothetical protein